ncbi:hypothetical protein D0C16_22375 [Cellvibrio sp. KY-GH-1]|uniref:DUF637 domain-containing protein n=1 Tax=Cellvibrio sp. KY-GH-1 TaxID=2303332 RepID=UPI001245E3F6|nr:DUF637 domain-containing protein [Cellvibrio sp. KY-GH-1]QEY18481.1 hypothetical protein D0C16_22375 [Cellvibrio sp. KY-GH-1]
MILNKMKRKKFKSYISLKQRITAAFMVAVMLLQICVPTVALAATAWGTQAEFNRQLQLQLESGLFSRVENTAADDAYKGAYYIYQEPQPTTNLLDFYRDYNQISDSPVIKMVGDTFVQTRLIRSQIKALLGRFLIPKSIAPLTVYAAEAEQINKLYAAGIGYGGPKDNRIPMGTLLAANASVATDMIWPEVRTITTSTGDVNVWVPVVHLSQATMESKVDGHDINLFGDTKFAGLTLSEDVLLTGGNNTITGVNGIINNGGNIQALGNITLSSSGTIANLGGVFSATGNLKIVADNFYNKTLVVPYKDKNGEGTKIGRVAQITGSSIEVVAADGITFEGASAVSTEGTLTLSAENDINILPVQTGSSGQSQSGHWEINKSTTDLLMSRLVAEDTLSLIAGGVINITASELISTRGGIELLAKNGIHILDELEQTTIQKEDRKGKTTGTSSEFRTEAVRAILKAGKGVLLDSDFGDVTLRATEITSTEGAQVNAKNGKVHLLMTKELEEFHLQTVKKGSWTIKTRTEDVIHENNIQNAIIGGLEVQAKYGINVEYTGKEDASLRQQLDEYAKMPEMAWMAKLYNKCWVEKEDEGITLGAISATDPANATNCDGPKVSWKQIEEVHKEIRKSKSTLSPAAMAIIAIAVCIAMGPAGAGLIGAGGIGGATVTATSLAGVTTVTTTISLSGAIAQAAMLTLATQAAQSLAAGNNLRETISSFDSDENLRSLAISMATAGAMNYTGVGKLELFDVPPGTEYNFASFGNQAYNAVVGATINSAVSVTINGGNSDAYKDAFKQSLALQAVNTIGDVMTEKIGGFASGQNPQINEAMKYIALAGTGCIIGLASSSASSSSSNSSVCYSGAGGAVIGEYVGELYSESKQREQQALIEKYLLEKGIANTTDFYNLDPMAYGQLVAQRPKFTHEEIFNMKLIGVDLAKLSAALTAFVAGADVNVAADAGERASRYSAFYNFDAAMEAVAAIDHFMKLEDVSKMVAELQLVMGDESKIDVIIKKFIATGKFEFLRGLSVVEALDALIKYVKLNGDSLKLVDVLRSVMDSFPSGRIKLFAAPYRDGTNDQISSLQDSLLRAKNSGLYDPRVHVESEKLLGLMAAAGFDPNDNEFVKTLNRLIELAPAEDRRAIKYVVGMALGVNKFLVDTGGDLASTADFVAGTPVAATEMILFYVTGDPVYHDGAVNFMEAFGQLQNVLSSLDDVPENIINSYKEEIKKAEVEEQNGNYIEAGKIRAAAGLTVVSLAIGVGAVIKSVGRAVAKNGSHVDFGDFADELDENIKANGGRVDGEFYGVDDIIPSHIFTSKTKLQEFISEYDIPLKNGWTVERLYNEVLSKPKGQRPLPEEYLPANYIASQLSQFDPYRQLRTVN